MVDFEKIKDINKRINKTTLKKRDGTVLASQYVQVKDRVLAFREAYADGKIITHVELISDNSCICKAEIYDGEELIATGTAYESREDGGINRNSFVENCETSAVGRAIGFLGIGINTSIASAEEVKKATRASDRQIQLIIDIYERTGGDFRELLDKYKVQEIDDLTSDQATRIISDLKKNGWKP